MSKPFLIFGVSLIGVLALATGVVTSEHVKLVLLWTDILIYVLILVVGSFAVQVWRKEHLRAPWHHVSQRPLAMAAAVVLSVYVIIGVLDSIHFREPLDNQAGQTEMHYSGEVVSLFDKLAGPLGNQGEKTYSAPFASHLFTKETIDSPQGRIRAYPRLQYGGRHLADPDRDFWPDLVKGASLSLIYSLFFWLVILAAVTHLITRHYASSFIPMLRRIAGGTTSVPFRSLFLTSGLICYLVAFILIFGDKYHILGTARAAGFERMRSS